MLHKFFVVRSFLPYNEGMFLMKRKHRKLIYLLIGLALFSYQAFTNYTRQTQAAFPKDTLAIVPINPVWQQVEVEKVVDGDTIELTNGAKVRYIGINTPETSHPTKGRECFGKEAKEKNLSLLQGQKILLAKDVSDTDRYGRLLRFVYLPNPEATTEALFVNQYLVEQGYAYAASYPPDISKNDIFRESQAFAEANVKGLWNRCKN